MQPSQFSVAVPGARIACWTFGAGRPVIVISGGPGFSSTYLWPPLLPIAKHCALTFFDQPGCGESDSSVKPTADTTVQAVASVIRAVAREEPYIIVAHSWGAYLLARLSEQQDWRPPIASVLLNPVPLDRAGLNSTRGRLIARISPIRFIKAVALYALGTRAAGRQVIQLILPHYFGREDRLPSVDVDFDIATYNSVLASLGAFSYWEALPRMGNLTLMFGSADYISVDDYADHFPDARRLTIAGAGHFLMFDAGLEILAEIGRHI